jgi:hypothetical protein
MALFDAMFEFSDDQVLTDSSAAATNHLDMVVEDLEMGAGNPFWLNVKVGTAFAGGTSVTIALVYDTATPVDGSSIVTWQTRAIPLTSTTAPSLDTAGEYLVRMPLPYNFDEESIVGLYYTVAGTFTAGTLNAWLDNGPSSSHGVQVTTSNI